MFIHDGSAITLQIQMCHITHLYVCVKLHIYVCDLAFRVKMMYYTA